MISALVVFVVMPTNDPGIKIKDTQDNSITLTAFEKNFDRADLFARGFCNKKGKQRGILSVLLQAYYDIEYCFTIDENVFTPPPKVKSGVIKLMRNSRKKLPCDEKLFKQIVKAGFNQRRKTLRNALKSFSLENELVAANLLQKRAEELSVEDFITITLICQKKLK